MSDEKPKNGGMTTECMSKMKEMMESMVSKGGSCCACCESMAEMMTACCAGTAESKGEKDPPK
ncbi:MAG TPA: hypothetical protein VEF34_18450 [Syntrophobacteraceae bacterium]|nr:hypothetical protein [Syntrophobacteraceae bacterium]